MIERIKDNPVITGQAVLLLVAIVAAILGVDAQWLVAILGAIGVPVTVAQRSKVTPTRKAAQ